MAHTGRQQGRPSERKHRPDRSGSSSLSKDQRPNPVLARPLYQDAKRAQFQWNMRGNAGLWYDKFCDRWLQDGARLSDQSWTTFAGDSAKLEWIKTVANIGGTKTHRKTVGDPHLLEEVANRVEELARANGGTTFQLATVWRFVTGLGRNHPVENGFAWHHTLGTPYIPGSSLKGLTRAYARNWDANDPGASEKALRVFGPAPETELSVGSVVFLDAVPTEPVALEADVMTPHYAPWYQADAKDIEKNPPADWYDPTPIPFLTVAPGQVFLFAVLPRTATDEARQDCAVAANWLKRALDTLGAGAKTAVGYGQFLDDPAARRGPKEEAGSRERRQHCDASNPPSSRPHGTVFGEPVEVLSRGRDGKLTVRFLQSGDIDSVSPDEFEPD
jgi:CRISPR-associated protein Cmr6